MAKQVTAADFDAEVLQHSGVVLVDFFATWCGPCQAMMPVLEELGSELPADAAVVKVDIDQAAGLASQYGVMSIPTFKVFKNGAVVDEAMGMQAKENLLALFQKHA
ncbi:thioredoxin [bacterium]|jgi:thioredoxin 1|nr:thioredoxin [bacterium]MBT6831498.1 thioredoxin [bacterium]MBT6996052.1 thioredoxin [bacterium]MBT7772173.1 thioredoxin [bacterium]